LGHEFAGHCRACARRLDLAHLDGKQGGLELRFQILRSVGGQLGWPLWPASLVTVNRMVPVVGALSCYLGHPRASIVVAMCVATTPEIEPVRGRHGQREEPLPRTSSDPNRPGLGLFLSRSDARR
jgi:hypothetical protein